MRRELRAVMMIGTFMTCLAGGGAAAQDRPTDTMEVVREKLRTDKKLVVATALELTESEAKRFWPVYNAYQSDMIAHYDRVLKLLETYAGAYQAMTDETATQLLTQYLALESNQVALLKGYAPRFQKVLPPKKVAQLYQVENKAKAIVNYELAQQIPLIK
jgi:hypothetical protein